MIIDLQYHINYEDIQWNLRVSDTSGTSILFRGCLVEMYGQYVAGGEQFVYCREVVHSLECLLSEFPL